MNVRDAGVDGSGAIVSTSPSAVARRPPPAGALVPGENVVDRGVGLPRSMAARLILGLGGVLSVQVICFGVFSLSASDAVNNATFVGLLGTLVGYGLLLRRQYRRRNRLAAAPAFDDAAEMRGQPVVAAGVVQPPAHLLTTPRGQSAVLARYQGSVSDEQGPRWFSRWRWELHAIDFCIRGDDGRLLWVDPAHLILLPHPPVTDTPPESRRPLYLQTAGETGGPFGWVYEEEVIGPGDRVELSGILDLESHPSASAGSDRQPRLRPVLRGTAKHPIRIRHHFVSLPPPT